MLAVLLAISPARQAQACGDIADNYGFFNLFVPQWLFGEAYSPTFYTAHDYHNIWARPDYASDNLKSWTAFFGKPVNEEVLRKVLYDEYIEGYANVKREVLLTALLFERSLVPIPKQEASIKYLRLALEMESLGNRNTDRWDYDPKTELSDSDRQALIGRLQEAFEQEKYPYLKNRYAFQLLKAYRYTDRADRAMQFYREYFEPLKDKDLIAYWAMDHYAGLLLGAGKRGAGYHHFLQVFQASPSRRHSAYHSLDITTAEDWSATYALCESPEEKALMHFVRGTKDKVQALEDMKSIFGLLGNHEWLRIVMARELNKLEGENFDYYGERPAERLIEQTGAGQSLLKNQDYQDYAGQLLKFATTAYYNNRGDGFWVVSKAYLEFMLGRMETAKLTLSGSGELSAPHQRIKDEISLVLQLLLQDGPLSVEEDDAIAEQLISIFDDQQTVFSTPYNNQELVLDLLAYRKAEQGQHLLAELLRRRVIQDTKVDPSHAEVDSLLAFVETPGRSLLEALAFKHFTGNDKPWPAFRNNTAAGLRDMRDELLDIKGRLLMREPERLQEAVAIFDALPERFDFPLEHNPFNIGIHDCVHCPGSTRAAYTRNAFVRKLAEMYELAESTNNPTDFYLLGNAYYNMSYYGPAHYLMSYFRSGVSLHGFYDCSVAFGLYEQAVRYAADKEFAAKACFMAAKAQQNMFFAKKTEENKAKGEWWSKYEIGGWSNSEVSYETFRAEIKAAGYRAYADRLKADYGGTLFYQQAIRECNYLN